MRARANNHDGGKTHSPCGDRSSRLKSVGAGESKALLTTTLAAEATLLTAETTLLTTEATLLTTEATLLTAEATLLTAEAATESLLAALNLVSAETALAAETAAEATLAGPGQAEHAARDTEIVHGPDLRESLDVATEAAERNDSALAAEATTLTLLPLLATLLTLLAAVLTTVAAKSTISTISAVVSAVVSIVPVLAVVPVVLAAVLAVIAAAAENRLARRSERALDHWRTGEPGAEALAEDWRQGLVFLTVAVDLGTEVLGDRGRTHNPEHQDGQAEEL